jgi:hypothetical protein
VIFGVSAGGGLVGLGLLPSSMIKLPSASNLKLILISFNLAIASARF